MATTTTNLGLTLPAVSDAADIGVLNSNFQKLDNVSGYGMGTPAKLLTSADDLFALTTPGRYRWSSDAPQNAPGTNMMIDLMFRDKNGTVGVAYFYTHSPYPIYQKYGRMIISNGAWKDFEWFEPPMSLGVEYLTTERWQGKAVYTMLVNFGALPNSTDKMITVSAIKDATALIGVSGDFSNAENGITCGDLLTLDGVTAHWIDLRSTGMQIGLVTNQDLTNINGRMTVKYVKD